MMNNSTNDSIDISTTHYPRIYAFENEKYGYRLSTMALIVTGVILNIGLLVHLMIKKKLNVHFQYCLWHLCITNVVQYVGFVPYALVEVRDLSQGSGIIVNYAVCVIAGGKPIFSLALLLVCTYCVI